MTEPKPLRWGADTGGPPCSCQDNRKRPASIVQSMVRLPPTTDNAPYLMALVHSSWMAIDKATALLG